jgi:ElaB/YqjD/DUF883 family membrane-anchored ribosome-binding protein
MGAPIRTSSDIPDFSTYPSSPGDQLPSSPRAMRVGADHQLPSDTLHDVATQVGGSIGSGMNVVREIADRAAERMQGLRESMDELYVSARDRTTEIAQAKFDEVRAQSQVQMRRAKQYAEAKPLHVIAAAGVAGLVLGFSARAWRSNRG